MVNLDNIRYDIDNLQKCLANAAKHIDYLEQDLNREGLHQFVDLQLKEIDYIQNEFQSEIKDLKDDLNGFEEDYYRS